MNQLEKRLKRIEDLTELMISELEGLKQDAEENEVLYEQFNLQLDDLFEFMIAFSPNASESALITKKMKTMRKERRKAKDATFTYGKIHNKTIQLTSLLIEYQKQFAEAKGSKHKKYVFRTETEHDFYSEFDSVMTRETFTSKAPRKNKEKKLEYLMERLTNQYNNEFWRLTSFKNGKTIIEHRQLTKIMDVMIEKGISIVRCNDKTARLIDIALDSVRRTPNIPSEKKEDLLDLTEKLVCEIILQ